MRAFVLLLPVALMAPVIAQKVEVKVASGEDQTLRFSIQSKIQTNDTRKTLINGEEPGAGRGGGGSGESSATQEVVFDQGPASANWRQYTKLAATETRPGQDGEPRETKIEGALQGKKVFLKTEGGKVSLVEGEGDKGKPVDEAIARDVPGRVSLAGLLPANAVAVGEEFDLGKTFGPALACLVHPVTPDRQQGAGGGGRGGRGQGGGGQGGGGQGGGGQGGGGQGGGQGGGGQGGGRGQGGRGGFGGMMGPVGATATQLISAGKLDVKATGKLASVEEKDGQKIAIIEITAKLAGKGKAADLGVRSMGAFGGRGRGGQGGGGQAADNGTDSVDANFSFTGKVRVNLSKNQIAGLDLDGDLTIGREIHRTMPNRDGGDDMKMDTTMNTKGKLQLKANCEAVEAKDAR